MRCRGAAVRARARVAGPAADQRRRAGDTGDVGAAVVGAAGHAADLGPGLPSPPPPLLPRPHPARCSLASLHFATPLLQILLRYHPIPCPLLILCARLKFRRTAQVQYCIHVALRTVSAASNYVFHEILNLIDCPYSSLPVYPFEKQPACWCESFFLRLCAYYAIRISQTRPRAFRTGSTLLTLVFQT